MAEFTFEDLYELLRAEKFSTDLQPFTEEQVILIKKYFEAKRELYKKQKESDLFKNASRDKLRDEIDNAKRAVKDFYEKREKKIITRSIYAARSAFNILDTTNMLKSEQVLYENLVGVLKKGLAGFFSQLSSKAAAAELQNLGKPLKEDLRLLKFIDSVPELLDSELKRYGPFSKDQTASLPQELAELLLKQNRAVEAQESKIIGEKKDEDAKNS